MNSTRYNVKTSTMSNDSNSVYTGLAALAFSAWAGLSGCGSAEKRGAEPSNLSELISVHQLSQAAQTGDIGKYIEAQLPANATIAQRVAQSNETANDFLDKAGKASGVERASYLTSAVQAVEYGLTQEKTPNASVTTSVSLALRDTEAYARLRNDDVSGALKSYESAFRLINPTDTQSFETVTGYVTKFSAEFGKYLTSGTDSEQKTKQSRFAQTVSDMLGVLKTASADDVRAMTPVWNAVLQDSTARGISSEAARSGHAQNAAGAGAQGAGSSGAQGAGSGAGTGTGSNP